MLWNKISAFHPCSDCFHFLLVMVLVHTLLWTWWYRKIISQFFPLSLPPPQIVSFPFPERHKDRLIHVVPEHGVTQQLCWAGQEEDGAGKVGTYLICCSHLVQSLGRRGLVDRALVAWVIPWLAAPIRLPFVPPSLSQQHFQAVLSLMFIAITTCWLLLIFTID